MRSVVVFFAVLAVGFADFDPGLRLKFNYGLGVGTDFFYSAPQTVDEAIAMEWTQKDRPTSPLSSLLMYCAPEMTVCLLYDDVTYFVAGVQVCLPMNEFTNATFDWETQGFISWTPDVENGTSVTYMTKQLYFISEATLQKSTAERNETALAKQVLQESAVWVTGFNQELLEIPTNVTGIVDAGFTKQACIPWMGQHYYYNMSTETPCKADTMLSWFPLTSDEKLIGMGFMVFGVLPESGEKFYFERPAKLAVQVIVNDGPECLYELAGEPTVTTMHIYFIDSPTWLFCPLF